ncbi:hypothetical protein HQ576_01190, partial [bacterium]|nr:hypothetical protein [bacterium]
YEDYLPWTWHFSKDPLTGRTVLTKESNTRWCRRPMRRLAPITLDSRPASGFTLHTTPAIEIVTDDLDAAPATTPTRRSPPRDTSLRLRPTYASTPPPDTAGHYVYRACGTLDGHTVYRRLSPSEAVAEELGVNGLK